MKNPANSSSNGLAMVFSVVPSVNNRSANFVKHPKMQQLMASGQKFDLFVLGWFFNDFLLGFGGHFRCPIVVMTTFQPLKSIRDWVGNPTSVASVPLSRDHGTERMTFSVRVKTFIMYTFELVACSLFDYFIHEPYYAELFPPDVYPTFSEVKRNVSLVLVNHHFSQGKPMANLPNMVEVSGIQIKDVPDALPEVSHEHHSFSQKVKELFLFSSFRSCKTSSTKRSTVPFFFRWGPMPNSLK